MGNSQILLLVIVQSQKTLVRSNWLLMYSFTIFWTTSILFPNMLSGRVCVSYNWFNASTPLYWWWEVIYRWRSLGHLRILWGIELRLEVSVVNIKLMSGVRAGIGFDLKVKFYPYHVTLIYHCEICVTRKWFNHFPVLIM